MVDFESAADSGARLTHMETAVRTNPLMFWASTIKLNKRATACSWRRLDVLDKYKSYYACVFGIATPKELV